MSPLRAEQLKQIRDNRKEQIMNAALKVFARRGFIGAKTNMIATEAGLSEGLLYKYFKSKDELFITLVEQAIDGSMEVFQLVYQFPGSPLEKLRTLSKHILDKENQDGFLLVHQARTGDCIPEQARQLIQNYSNRRYAEQLIPLIEKGQQTGEFISGEPSELASCYIKVLSGLMTLSLDIEDESLPEVDWLLRLVINPIVHVQEQNKK
ncbi:TetR/AcrR family transcriptional regulator [Shimazuella kribbensis]|uniref:TetR/AcrR family transcriptional regulator n=1 Tax=Shimazuella kribbensis TaxID=139808 RepID=UPI0003FB8C02|nr:TetR/AcrR family transcriptional regulator [Shimazuella kribbensis]